MAFFTLSPIYEAPPLGAGNDYAVAVTLVISSGPTAFVMTAETVGNHQLVGQRSWIVELSSVAVSVTTAAEEQPRGIANAALGNLPGAYAIQEATWRINFGNIALNTDSDISNMSYSSTPSDRVPNFIP